jgi:hypothetical protein
MVEVGPDESILHKRRINLHKIREYSSYRFKPTMTLRLRSAVEQKKIQEGWRKLGVPSVRGVAAASSDRGANDALARILARADGSGDPNVVRLQVNWRMRRPLVSDQNWGDPDGRYRNTQSVSRRSFHSGGRLRVLHRP